MKGIHFLSFIALLSLGVSCAESEPVATGYKKQLGAPGSGNAQPQPAPAPPPPPPGGGNGDANPGPGGGDGGDAGDAAAGLALFDANCKSCHQSGGLAKNKLPDASLAPLVAGAIAKQPSFHQGFKDGALSAGSIPDLEAYLKSL